MWKNTGTDFKSFRQHAFAERSGSLGVMGCPTHFQCCRSEDQNSKDARRNDRRSSASNGAGRDGFLGLIKWKPDGDKRLAIAIKIRVRHLPSGGSLEKLRKPSL